jgi:hypothetical protein
MVTGSALSAQRAHDKHCSGLTLEGDALPARVQGIGIALKLQMKTHQFLFNTDCYRSGTTQACKYLISPPGLIDPR